jgi:hypothetical protein
MAGVVPPTVLSLIVFVGISIASSIRDFPFPVERFIVFPLVVIPNLWGIWNGVWALTPRRRLPLAVHGAVLPILNFALGYWSAKALGIEIPDRMANVAPVSLAMTMIFYAPVWKYAVGFLNTIVDVD